MKMEFDSEQIHRFIKSLKNLESELLACRVVYEFVLSSGRFSSQELEILLTGAKREVQLEMNKKYDEALQKLSGIHDQESALKALKFLAQWTPKGPIH